MTYKQIEASREVRLWVTQVVIPTVCIVMMIPEARKAVVDKAKEVNSKIKSKFHN